MRTNDWDFKFPESFLRTLAGLNKMQLSESALAISEAWKSAVPNYNFDGVSTALREYVAISQRLEDITIPTKTLLGLQDAINAWQTFRLPDISTPVLPQIDPAVFDVLKNTSTITALAKADWSWVFEACAEVNADKDTAEDNEPEQATVEKLTPELRDEITADITQILSAPEEMSAASQSKYLQWKERNPGHAAFFLEVLLPLLQVLIAILGIGESFWSASTAKNTKVYEEPTSTSNVVYNITVEQHVTVVGDAPYFHEIEFIDSQTGEPVTGFVYKGKLAAEDVDGSLPAESVDITNIEVSVSERAKAPDIIELPE